MTRITCWLNRNHIFYHTARWLSGLWLLHKSGEISLRFLIRPHRASASEPTDSILPFEIDADGKTRRAIADFRDRSDLFSLSALGDCDVYFKRSYYAADIPKAHAAKILPLGLNFTCRAPGLTTALCRAQIPHLISAPFVLFTWLRRQFRCLSVVPPQRAIEQSPSHPARRAVIFQTRLWDESDVGPTAPQINETRVCLLRALRESLGAQFYGGLVPTRLAKQKFPDLLAPGGGNKSNYLKSAQSHLVGIYTEGLHHSTGWKLGEYLAASQCIVAERPRNALPKHLIEGTNYLSFSTPDECVTACRRLLEEQPFAQSMRQANRKYYVEELAPDAWVRNRLSEALTV
jgi:hypothetical protein